MLVTADNFEIALNLIKTSKDRIMALDLETTGLQPYHGDKIAGIAIYSNNNPFYFPFRHEGENLPLEYMNPLRALLSLSTIRWVFWNAKFDLQFLLKEKFPYPQYVEDPMLAAHMMNEFEDNFKLKDLGRKYIGADAKDEQNELVEELQKRGYGKGSISRLPAELVTLYAEQDVILTYQLRYFYAKNLKQWGLFDLWQEFNEYIRFVVEIERRGMLLDTERINSLIDFSVRGMESSTKTISQMAGYEVNPNSSKQVCHLLGLASSAIGILEDLDSPMVKPIIQYRRHSKMKGTYYEKFLEVSTSKGVLHPSLNMIGTETGRFSCSNPNLQALPRGTSDPDDPRNNVKQAFISREGHLLVQADYKQAEVYLGAHYAKADNLLKMIEQGVDMHSQTAQMLGIPRYAAKRMNFAIMYGIGAASLKADIKKEASLVITEKQAADYIAAYNKVNPQMNDLYKRMEREAKANKIIRLFTGRVKHFAKYRGMYPKYSEASSNLIQGGVGELIRIASTNLQRTLYSEGVRPLMQVHDSLILEVPEEKASWLVPAIAEVMTDFSRFNFTVKFKVDVATGHRLSDLK